METYSALSDVLSSEHTYAGSLADPDALEVMVESVTEIDRLPKANTIEGMRILTTAWDKIDIYAYVAKRCKKLSKVTYLLLLALSLATTVLIVSSNNMPKKTVPPEKVDFYVLLLTIATTMCVGFISYINPQAKWQQLRGAAQALRSEMWKFRTRSGPYQQMQGDPATKANLLYKQFVDDVSKNVMKSATIANTSFMARATGLSTAENEKDTLVKNPVYVHGQYKAPRRPKKKVLVKGRVAAVDVADGEIFDDYQSPCTPEEYLQLRVLPQLKFYQARLPVYQRMNNVWETLLMLSSIAGVVLSFFREARWAAIPTALTVCVTAYAEFHATEKKLVRYSEAIAKIDSIKMWWDSLSNVERVNLAFISTLVSGCEDTFNNEREAWASTSMVSAEMNAKAGKKNDAEEEG